MNNKIKKLLHNKEYNSIIDKPFTYWFKEQINFTPDKIALKDNSKKMSYEELGKLSEKISNSIILKTEENSNIVVFLDRSADLLVSLIGIFSANRCYIPVDPNYPKKRVQYILETARCKTIITNSVLFNVLKSFNLESIEDFNIIIIDTVLSSENIASHDVSCDMISNAYIIFTSGSTGKPKGAIVNHKGMMNHLLAKIIDLNLNESDKIIQNSSQCFDISIWQFLCLLLVGGEVHIANEEVSSNPRVLFNYVNDEEITILEVVPSFLISYLDFESELHKLKLKYLILTGDVLKIDLVKKWFLRYPEIKMVNAYGPTECSDDITHFIIDQNYSSENVSIGKSIINTELIVAKFEDNKYKVCQEFELGELFVTGDCLGNGYINDLEKTNAAFINNIFNEDKIYYKTGDLVSKDNEGNYYFHGRIDRQIKINGFRVELAEIESIIKKQENIKDCIVYFTALNENSLVSRKHIIQQDNTKHLVCYLILKRPDVLFDYDESIKKILKENLPYYMIPHLYQVLDDFPLNENGKIDYKKLSIPKISTILSTDFDEFIVPSTEIEVEIHSFIAEIIKTSNFGVNSNFFEIGMDSLKFIRLINLLKDKYKITLKYIDIVSNPNVILLSKVIMNRTVDEKTIQSHHEIESELNLIVNPLSSYQRRIWFVSELEKNNPYYNFSSVLDIKSNDIIDTQKIYETLEELIKLSPQLLVKFKRSDDEIVQEYLDYKDLPILFLNLTDVAYNENIIIDDVINQSKIAIDLNSELPLKVKIYKLTDFHFQINFIFHEIILDGWGACKLVENFYAVFNSVIYRIRNNVTQTSFDDFIRHDYQNSNKKDLINQRNRWVEKINEYDLEELKLATDFEKPKELKYFGDSKAIFIPIELTLKLKRLAIQNETTIFNVLNSLYKLVLYFYSNQNTISVGSPIANRNSLFLENLINFNINMITTINRIDSDITYKQFLLKEIDFSNFAIENSEISFDEVVTAVNPHRSNNNSPLFQVMFNMLNFPFNRLTDSNLEIDFKEIDYGFTKYDLSLYAQENNNEIYLQLSYLTELFKEESIDRILNSLISIAEQITENENLLLKKINPLSKKDIENITVLDGKEFSIDKASFGDSLNQILFNKPELNILKYQGVTYSFIQLATFINYYFDLFDQYNIVEGSTVIIDVERGVDCIALIYALTMRGIIYIPLSERFPLEVKLNLIKKHSPTKVLTANEQLIDKVVLADIEIIDIKSAKNQNSFEYYKKPVKFPIENQSNTNCIIFTSGTTGEPKGVKIQNKSILNRLEWMWNEFPFYENDVVLFHKSISIVGTFWELYGGILKGIKTIYLTLEEQKNPQLIWENIINEKITFFHSSPIQIESLLDYFDSIEYIPEMDNIQLRVVTSSADYLSKKTLDRWNRMFKKISIINLYGLTEASSNITQFDTKLLSEDFFNHLIPVGKPIYNTKIEVVNSIGGHCPAGVEGNILIKGIPVADQKEILKTSDFGIWNNFGLSVTNRDDGIVKVRGFRVDLKYIREIIKNFHEIKDAYVEYNDSKIITYLVYDEDSPNFNFLNEYLIKNLPDYMIPEIFYKIQYVPKGQTGKIIKSELKRMNKKIMINDKKIIKPYTELQIKLAEIWSLVLERNDIGINDNFFTIGGNSIKALQLFMQINKLLNVKITIKDIFLHPTIKLLEEFLISKIDGVPICYEVTSCNVESDVNVIMIPPLFSSLYIFESFIEKANLEIKIYGFEYDKFLDGLLVEDIAAKFLDQFLQLQDLKNHIIIGYSDGGILGYELSKRLEKIDHKVNLVLLDTDYNNSNKELTEIMDFKSKYFLFQDQINNQNIKTHSLDLWISYKSIQKYKIDGSMKGDIYTYTTDDLITDSQDWFLHCSNSNSFHFHKGNDYDYDFLNKVNLEDIIKTQLNIIKY